jgi:hypothetical protein
METREATVEDLRDLPPELLASYAKGLPNWAVDWLFHDNHPKAVENRRFIRASYAAQAYWAAERQKQYFEQMKATAHLIDPKAPIRPLGTIDPFYVADYKAKYGSECLHDPKFLDDCKKTAPQLFYPDPPKRPMIVKP